MHVNQSLYWYILNNFWSCFYGGLHLQIISHFCLSRFNSTKKYSLSWSAPWWFYQFGRDSFAHRKEYASYVSIDVTFACFFLDFSCCHWDYYTEVLVTKKRTTQYVRCFNVAPGSHIAFAKQLCNWWYTSYPSFMLLFDAFYHTRTYYDPLILFLPFCMLSLYMVFPRTVFCCEKGLQFSQKWFMTVLGWWFCLLHADICWRCCDISFYLSFSIKYSRRITRGCTNWKCHLPKRAMFD